MSSIDLDPPTTSTQQPHQDGTNQEWSGNLSQTRPDQHQPSPAISGTTTSVPQLGKEFDLGNIQSELSSLIDKVNGLIMETETVFNQLENIYFNQASPIDLTSRLFTLNQGYQKLFNALRISGLGALPIKKSAEQTYDIHTLIESLQQAFQALFHERERRRDGSAIVLSILQPHLPSL